MRNEILCQDGKCVEFTAKSTQAGVMFDNGDSIISSYKRLINELINW